MPVHDIAILTSIVTVFIAFAVVLESVTRYCNDTRRHALHLADNRRAHHPPDMSVIIDD